MSEDSSQDIRKHVKTYLGIGAIMIVLTLLMVWGLLHYDLSTGGRIGLVVLTFAVQAVLSVGYLMHLHTERALIYIVLLLTIVLFAVLIALPLLTASNPVEIKHVP